MEHESFGLFYKILNTFILIFSFTFHKNLLTQSLTNLNKFLILEFHWSKSHLEHELRRTKRTIYQSLLKRKDSNSYVNLMERSISTTRKPYIVRQSKPFSSYIF